MHFSLEQDNNSKQRLFQLDDLNFGDIYNVFNIQQVKAIEKDLLFWKLMPRSFFREFNVVMEGSRRAQHTIVYSCENGWRLYKRALPLPPPPLPCLLCVAMSLGDDTKRTERERGRE